MAQLNFNIPDPLLARLDAAKPDYLDRKGFLCLLLDQSLVACATLGLSTEGESPSSSKAVSKERITKAIKSIPVLLEKHEGLIREFWKSKGGAKSDTAWKLLMTELEKLQKAYGDAVVKEQLELAINGRWKGVSMRLYEQFKAPKGNTPTQPSEPNREHGTGRVFTAADFYGETNPDNPLKELF